MDLLVGIPLFFAILAFCLVIFIHELGHYLVGRWCGIGASDFSIGFGPELYSYTDSRKTKWKLCLIPLGGYVKFLSKNSLLDDNQPNNKVKKVPAEFGNSFDESPLLLRALTVFAGPLANFLLSIFLFTVFTLLSGVSTNKPVIGTTFELPGSHQTLKQGDRVISIENQPITNYTEIIEISSELEESNAISVLVERDNRELKLTMPFIFQPIVLVIETLSPASRAGLEVGDVFLSVENKKIKTFEDVREAVLNSNGDALSFKVWRSGKVIDILLIPENRPTETSEGDIVETMRIGVRGGAFFSPSKETPSVFDAIIISFDMTWYVIKMSLTGVARIIDNSISAKHLSGPVGVAKALTETSKQGFIPFIGLVAAISAGLGLVNLFPIPILDGGHLVLFFFEAIFKRRPPEIYLKSLMAIGLVLVLGIMLFATYNDLMR